MGTWRLLNTGRASGPFNMAVDDALVEGVAAGEIGPVLRLFGWNPPAVSFGYGQNPRREVDLERCRRAGVDLVRRPTGGRAVLHWEELTYSVSCRQDDPELGGRIDETYRLIGQCLVEGLRLFGVETSLERVNARAVRVRGEAVTAPCFSSAARWEVKCRGRKLIGSAQRRVDGAILQHGSLLTGPAHLRLLDLLTPIPAPLQEEWRRQLEQESIHLGECTDRELDIKELAACLAAGFGRQLGVEIKPAFLTFAEERRVQKLNEERYGDPLWTYGPGNGEEVASSSPIAVEP